MRTLCGLKVCCPLQRAAPAGMGRAQVLRDLKQLVLPARIRMPPSRKLNMGRASGRPTLVRMTFLTAKTFPRTPPAFQGRRYPVCPGQRGRIPYPPWLPVLSLYARFQSDRKPIMMPSEPFSPILSALSTSGTTLPDSALPHAARRPSCPPALAPSFAPCTAASPAALSGGKGAAGPLRPVPLPTLQKVIKDDRLAPPQKDSPLHGTRIKPTVPSRAEKRPRNGPSSSSGSAVPYREAPRSRTPPSRQKPRSSCSFQSKDARTDNGVSLSALPPLSCFSPRQIAGQNHTAEHYRRFRNTAAYTVPALHPPA